jgi:hypothetical protein
MPASDVMTTRSSIASHRGRNWLRRATDLDWRADFLPRRMLIMDISFEV